MNRADMAEAAAALRRLLEAVARGDLDADSSMGRVILRQMEGAATALLVAAAS